MMKHIVYKIYSIIKKLFFFFRVIVTLEIGKSDATNSEIDSEKGDQDD